MFSAVARYKQLLSSTLARYFPRTTAYLRAEREAAVPAKPARKPGRKKATGRKRSSSTGTTRNKPGPGGIYPITRFRLNDAQAQAMREQVARAVTAGLIGAPSDEQWAMILCRAPLSRIFAGAGSGKSSTLVLRVVFMLCHLGIDPQRLTVISFTNASCAELRERLRRLLEFWGYTGDVRLCVRTFHAAMAAVAREQLGNVRWFEQLDEPGDEPDNPLTGSRLRSAQLRLLKQAYQQAYCADSRFRVLVHRLLQLPAVKEDEKNIPKAPLDTCNLAGEFAALPLYELLYTQIDFAESLGIRLEQLQPERLSCASHERDFIETMQRFQQHFAALLHSQGLITFNSAFARLSEARSMVRPTPALLALSHLLIDEFQDISPQIVRWLQAVHRRLHGAGERISLMAIGDDWQSIYGWRGSSPELFINFDRHFPSHNGGRSTTLVLSTNYRSVEPVIRDAEKVLSDVHHKQARTSIAARPLQPGDHGVRLIQRFDLNRDLPKLLIEIRAQCDHVARRPGAERSAVLLLSRRNESLQQVRSQLEKNLPVRAMTIHRAKGLQAEVAIILDDCLPAEKHPLRNTLYAYCGFFSGSYDQAMQDEARRLAYVAITRGVSRVLWYTRRAQGASALLTR
ncbi:DEAD/DEAH box helicase [Pseudomonas sp. NCCP-436]|uniref:DEAD/DEAH box helicase n=1 Tax=Pseudomonas sp. NCCP-436 TaxID=2842481 RepID=UPI001C7F1CD9|nr:DEAD/DEAH box helicase [Pseudomonas sp. NCCP-436]GIZ11312.1 DNA helicase [Pseudomonas sp. NCCP-436]